MADVIPPEVVKIGELHRKHPLIKTWNKYFVVLDTYTCKYFTDATAFYSGHHAFGIISLKGAMVFNGGESGTMNAPRIHIVTDPNAAHDIFDPRLTCFSHPDREVVEDWMEALQATIVKRENMEHQHASGPVSAEHTKQHGVVGVGLSIDSTGTDEGNNNNNSTGRKSLDLNPLHKIAQKFSKSHERDTVVGGNVDNAGNYNDTHRIGGRTRNDSDSNSLEGSGDMMMRAVDVDRKLNEIESITLEDPPLPSDDLEVLPHTIREDINQLLKQFRKNFPHPNKEIAKRKAKLRQKANVKWDFVCRKDKISVYKRHVTNAEEKVECEMKSGSTISKQRKRKNRVIYKAVCHIPATPQSIAAVICDPQSRPGWDSDFPFSTIVDNVGISTDILHVQGGVVWNETQCASSGSMHDHRDIVTETSRIENLNIFKKRGVGSFVSCIVCFLCSYYNSLYWNKENCGMFFGEIIPVEYFGMDASIFGAIVGGMFGGMLIGLLSNFFVVPLFSYMYWGGLILNPNEYFSKRDFCILRHVEISSVGDIEIVQRSVDNVRCPRTLVHVRGEVYGGGFYITPTCRNLWPGSKVEYIIDADFNGNFLGNQLNNAMLVNRIKVLPALREAVAHCMQQQRYVEKSTWKRGGMEKKYYILERPIGDCKHAERSNLIANVAFRRVWNDTSKHTCWVGYNALVTIDEASDSSEGGYRFKTIWDKRSRNSIATPMSGMADGSNKGKTSGKFDWIDGLPDLDNREEDTWDPEGWMHGMTRLATGGLKGVTNKHKDNTRTLGTRRLFVDVISDVAQDVFHSQGTAHYSDKMATHMLAMEARNLLEACTDNFLYAPNFLERAFQVKSNVERFKLVMAFAVSGLYKNARQTKPSIPDLGETYAGKLQNGSMCIVEMFGKEPPQVGFKVLSPSTRNKDKEEDGNSIGMSSGNESDFSEDEAYENMNYSEEDGNTSDGSSVQPGERYESTNSFRAKSPMLSDDEDGERDGRKSRRIYDHIKIRNRYGNVGSRWKVKGSWDLITLFKGNIIETSWHGPTTVVFNDGSRVRYTMPTVLMTGVMWGERVTEIVGEMIFSDHQNNLECHLRFNPHVKSGVESLFKKTVSDHVRGEILYKNKVVSVAEGSWLDGLYFDGKPYWEMHRDRPSKIVTSN